MMDSLKLNEDVCRICLKHGIKLNWNDEIFEFCGISYKDCFYKYTQLEAFDSDCYPTNLCEMCANELKNAHMLFEKALESFNILQAVLKTKLQTNYSDMEMCSISAMKYETNAFDEVNSLIDDKTQIERQICLSSVDDSYGIEDTENKINGCKQITMDEDVATETIHFIDIQRLEPSMDITLEPNHCEIFNDELPKLPAGKKNRVKRTKRESIASTALEQRINESFEKLLTASTTKKSVGKRRKCVSLTKFSWEQQVEDCSNNELPSPSATKTSNKIKNFTSLAATSLEQNLDKNCRAKLVLPATKPKKSREKYLLMCAYCSLKVNGRSKLAKHEATHSENRKRTEICPQCGIKLYNKLSLTQHMKTHDENRQKNHKCEFCGNAFYNRGSLNVHRRIHLGLMVKCQICAKDFFRQVDLDKHLLRHSASPLQRNVGKNKYTVQCEYCNKSVVTVKWKSHIAAHLGQPVVKCKICDKNFFSRTNCTNHLRRFHFKKSAEYENFIHYYGDGKTRVSILMMKQQLSAQPLTDKKCAEVP